MIKELRFQRIAQRRLSEAELQAIQQELGFRLPKTFLEFVRRYNGGYPADDNVLYSVPEQFGDYYEEYGRKNLGIIVQGLYGLSEEIEDCNALTEFKQLREDLSIAVFPIAFDIFGNQVVIKCDTPEGPVYWRDHELWGPNKAPSLFLIADRLELFYNGLVADLDFPE